MCGVEGGEEGGEGRGRRGGGGGSVHGVNVFGNLNPELVYQSVELLEAIDLQVIARL